MKRKFFKEPVIKQRLGKLSLFRRKENLVKPNSSQLKQNARRRFVFKQKEDGKRQLNSFNLSQESNLTMQIDKKPLRNWWIHLWSGLVIDKEAKHQRAMRQAVWLYLYLLMVSNWQTGTLFRRISTIVAETGFNRRSIGRWLRVLREKGYIETHSTGRALQISITKWKPIVPKKIKKGATDQQ